MNSRDIREPLRAGEVAESVLRAAVARAREPIGARGGTAGHLVAAERSAQVARKNWAAGVAAGKESVMPELR